MQYLNKLFTSAQHRQAFLEFLERLTGGTENLEDVFEHLHGQRGPSDAVSQRRRHGEIICTAAIWLLAQDAIRPERNRAVGALEPQTEILNVGLSNVAGFLDQIIRDKWVSLDTTDGFTQLALRKYWNDNPILQADVIRYLFRPSIYTEHFDLMARSMLGAVAAVEPAVDGVDLESFSRRLQELAFAAYQNSARDRLMYAGRAVGAAAPRHAVIKQCLGEVWDRLMEIWLKVIWALWRTYIPNHVADEYGVELLASSIQTYIDGAAWQLVWAPDDDQAHQLFGNGLDLLIKGWFTYLQRLNADGELDSELE